MKSKKQSNLNKLLQRNLKMILSIQFHLQMMLTILSPSTYGIVAAKQKDESKIRRRKTEIEKLKIENWNPPRGKVLVPPPPLTTPTQ